MVPPLCYLADLRCLAGQRARDLLANYRPARASELRFHLGVSLASSSAAVRHRLSVLPGTHPLCCLGNRSNVGGGAGTVHGCVAGCYGEFPEVAVALLHLLGNGRVLKKREISGNISILWLYNQSGLKKCI